MLAILPEPFTEGLHLCIVSDGVPRNAKIHHLRRVKVRHWIDCDSRKKD